MVCTKDGARVLSNDCICAFFSSLSHSSPHHAHGPPFFKFSLVMFIHPFNLKNPQSLNQSINQSLLTWLMTTTHSPPLLSPTANITRCIILFWIKFKLVFSITSIGGIAYNKQCLLYAATIRRRGRQNRPLTVTNLFPSVAQFHALHGPSLSLSLSLSPSQHWKTQRQRPAECTGENFLL